MNLLRALATVSSMTLVSRILGLVRDVLIATLFRTGAATDAFFVAFRIPNLLRRLFAEGAFSQAFVPVLSEYRTRRGDSDTKRLVDRTATLLALALLAATALGVAAAPVVIYVSAPGFAAEPEKFDLTVALQLPALAGIGMLPGPGFSLSDPGVRRILALMAPAVLGVSVAQVSLLINTIIASFLGNGRISWLYYADRLMEFPTALLGVALGTVLLPSLSKYHSGSADGEYSKLLDWGLRLTFILAAPAAVALALLAVPLVTTLFHYGEFGEQDVWMTRQALIAYSLGLLGLILVKVLAPGFYARQNIATPVRIAVLTLIATQLMNALFVLSLKRGGLEAATGIGSHAGLALAIAMGACLNAGLLYRKLRERGIYDPQPGWGAFALKVAAALAAMTVVLWLSMGPEQWWLGASGARRAEAITGLVLLGGAAYFASLWLLGFRLGDFTRRAA